MAGTFSGLSSTAASATIRLGLAALASSPPLPLAPALALVGLGCCSRTYGSTFVMAFRTRPRAEAGVAVAGVSFLAGACGAAHPAAIGR